MREPTAMPPAIPADAPLSQEQEPEDEILLSAESAEQMEAILRGAARLHRAEPEPLRVEIRVRYLAGALSPADIATAERALARFETNRAALRRTLTELRTLQALSWEQVSARTQAEDSATSVACAWLELLSERAQILPVALERQRDRSWAQLRQEVGEGLAQARAAWSAFLAFGQQALVESAQTRLAVVKSAASESLSWSPPPGLSAEQFFITARITNDRGLMLELNLVGVEAEAMANLVGQIAHVSMRIQGEAWHLGEIHISPQGGWLVVSEFGAVLDLPSGALPSHWFALALQTPFAPPPGELVGLLAAVEQRDGSSASMPPAPIEVGPLLHWEEGQLAIQVRLSPGVRAMYADYVLEFDLMVMAPYSQSLGAWPVQEWNEETRLLRVACPGSAAFIALPASLLRARLRPSAKQHLNAASA